MSRASRPPRVVAILPAYNLERSIAAIVERTKPFVERVVVVANRLVNIVTRA